MQSNKSSNKNDRKGTLKLMPKGCHHGAEIDAEISAGTMRTAAPSVSELVIIVLMIEQKVVPKLVLERNREIKKT